MACASAIWSKNKKESESALDITNTQALRGISAIEIMLGHIGIATGNIIQFPNRKAGILFVGIFFMISGYGLAYGFDNKTGYLKDFWKRRMPAIMIPALIVVIIDACYHKELSLILIFEGSARWYVTELLLLYLVFYVAYSFLGSKGWIAVTAISFGMILLAYTLRLSNPWYGSTACFSLGMIYYNFNSHSIKLGIIKRIRDILICFLISAVSIYGFFKYDGTFIGNVICRTFASMSFCVAIILILEVVHFGNKYSLVVATISYELYLLHAIIIDIGAGINNIIGSDYLFTMFVTVVSLMAAIMFHWIIKWLHHLIQKSNNDVFTRAG